MARQGTEVCDIVFTTSLFVALRHISFLNLSMPFVAPRGPQVLFGSLLWKLPTTSGQLVMGTKSTSVQVGENIVLRVLIRLLTTSELLMSMRHFDDCVCLHPRPSQVVLEAHHLMFDFVLWSQILILLRSSALPNMHSLHLRFCDSMSHCTSYLRCRVHTHELDQNCPALYLLTCASGNVRPSALPCRVGLS